VKSNQTIDMKLSLGFSPCPNDTFIFYALVHGKIDLQGLDVEVYMGDVEDLNEKAFNEDLDVTKISYHSYGYLTDKYILLNSGHALGNNCGPLLISKEVVAPEASSVDPLTIAIPGKYTTANLLLGLAFPNAQNKRPMLFSEIEQQVQDGICDAGLIIHENRFTYEAKGLKKIIDMGEYWEKLTGYPIPLGGIAIKRNLDSAVHRSFDNILKASVEYAFANPEETMHYVSEYAQEMDDQVMKQHIDLYVNDFSIELGQQGREAVKKLYDIATERKVLNIDRKDLFVLHN